MKKVLLVVRASTLAHSARIESQREEMKKWLNGLGYQDEEIEVLEYVASAHNRSTEYLQMLEDIKRLTTDDDIKTVAVSDLSRLGRCESDLLSLKMYFIEHKVNLIVKNPAIKLLNADGTVSAADNIVYSMCAAMADTKL